MCGHGHEQVYGHEHPSHYTPHHWFPQHEYGSGYHGYVLPPTREEELEILEKWKTQMEKWKVKMEKKLARIDRRIGELQKES
jgi:hypothetical protein